MTRNWNELEQKRQCILYIESKGDGGSAKAEEIVSFLGTGHPNAWRALEKTRRRNWTHRVPKNRYNKYGTPYYYFLTNEGKIECGKLHNKGY